MVVITVSNCPIKLRGDLTKWLFEIDTGVFVGNLNARVRDNVWERVCSNIGNGRATMAFSANNEQKLDFKIHNTEWEPIDYDGIKLVLRKLPDSKASARPEKSKAEQQHINRLAQRKKVPQRNNMNYVVIDIETTGLGSADIIEFGAIRIKEGTIADKFSVLVRRDEAIPKEIVELTGITDEMLKEQGVEAREAIEAFQEFCGESEIVGYNVSFDMDLIQAELMKNGLPPMINRTIDVLRMARHGVKGVTRYRLEEVAKYFQIEYEKLHRALYDCILTYEVYERLKGI